MKTRPARILILDDSPGLQELFRRRLTDEGYTVRLPPGSALPDLAAARPDLRIADYRWSTAPPGPPF